MLKKEILYSLNDIVIVPSISTSIRSRSECNPFQYQEMTIVSYPLFTAPMDFVKGNEQEFLENNIIPIVPRTVPFEKRKTLFGQFFCAFSLNEAEELYRHPSFDVDSRHYVLIDIANGMMEQEIKVGKRIKDTFNCKLMGGNIGNPATYLLYDAAGFDYLRVGIGDGAGCLTSKQLGVSYPYASLISEIAELKNRNDSHCEIIADGGMNSYSDIIKCLALGADYVMCGKLFAQAALKNETVGTSFTYRGMSTKSAQKDMGNKHLKTAEGRTLTLTKEYTLSAWLENFDSYLRSAMSYCNSRTLRQFRERAICQIVSSNASYKINDK